MPVTDSNRRSPTADSNLETMHSEIAHLNPPREKLKRLRLCRQHNQYFPSVGGMRRRNLGTKVLQGLPVSPATLRIVLIYLSIIWTSYTLWIQRYAEMQHRKTSIDSFQSLIADFTVANHPRQRTVDAAFYQIDIPVSLEEGRYISRIIVDQLQQISDAQARSVYYTTTGPADHELVTNGSIIQETCSKLSLNCVYQGHLHEEMEALSHIRSYCATSAHGGSDSDVLQVAFIHSKARVEQSKVPVNRRLRRALTSAALSHECSHALSHTDQCNVCGLHFAATHAMYFSGNMWSASCRYVQNLIEPLDYRAALEKVMGDALLKRHTGDIMMNLFQDKELGLGDSNTITEQWIGSRPDLKPCDVSRSMKFLNYLSKDYPYSNEQYAWQTAPKPAIRDALFDNKMVDVVLARTEYRLREFFLLPGHIMKWWSLYNEVPNVDSFVWHYFPDGRFWLKASQIHGHRVVEKVTSASSITLSTEDMPRSLPDPRPLFKTETFVDEQSIDSNLTVFYDVFIQRDADETELAQELEIIKLQMRALFDSEVSQKNVHYHSMGHDALAAMNICDGNPPTVSKCQRLGHFTDRYPAETLRRLSQFCRQNPSGKVSYVHNQLPEQLRKGRRVNLIRLIRALTMGAVSQLCHEVDTSTCNLCSLIFEPLPNHAPLGNMWTASCSYVNELLPLQQFYESTQRLIGQALVMNITGQLVIHDNDEEPALNRLGLGSDSIAQWIGSHPSLLPCDVTDQSPEYWGGANHHSRELRLRRFPTEHDQLARATIETSENASSRMRDWRYLAGNLLRWHALYGQSPGPESYVWKSFPDSSFWWNASTSLGNKTATLVTKQFIR